MKCCVAVWFLKEVLVSFVLFWEPGISNICNSLLLVAIRQSAQVLLKFPVLISVSISSMSTTAAQSFFITALFVCVWKISVFFFLMFFLFFLTFFSPLLSPHPPAVSDLPDRKFSNCRNSWSQQKRQGWSSLLDVWSLSQKIQTSWFLSHV